jgi:hypothetical protein
MKKQNLLLLAGAGTIYYFIWRKNQLTSSGVKGIEGIKKVKKSFHAQQVLKLMDSDYTYTSALNTVLALYPEVDKKTLVKELNQFI